ncbi:hypothetical protein C8R45DRAFT_1108067 [Mycena sanguinolenta]|nr:hypothetical protein C8R45DRAFT_1108067 [Mycena sanguinolenta]
MSIQIGGYSWDASVYAGLRQFHQAKGFNSESQDIALYLGHKPYQFSVPFAHIDDEFADNPSGEDIGRVASEEELDGVLESNLTDHDE